MEDMGEIESSITKTNQNKQFNNRDRQFSRNEFEEIISFSCS